MSEKKGTDKPRRKPKPLEPWQKADAEALRDIFMHKVKDPSKPSSQLKFGADYDIGVQSMVWQYLSGHRPLNLKAAYNFARGLQCYIYDFSPTLANQIVEYSKLAMPPPRGRRSLVHVNE